MEYVLELELTDSSLIKSVYWDDQTLQLRIVFNPKYYIREQTFENVPYEWFMQFSLANSFGKYYLQMIKPNFTTINSEKMSDTENKKKPKGINQSKKDGKRFIKFNINVRDIVKEWLHVGEKGTYLNCTLFMMPDGTVDAHGNLGMIVQDVPTKHVNDKGPDGKKVIGPILGNGAEYDWSGTTERVQPGTESGKAYTPVNSADDLPF